jgi:hypothetical protein
VRVASGGENLFIFEGGDTPVAICTWSKDVPFTIEFCIDSLETESFGHPNVTVLGSLEDDTLLTISQRFRERFYQERHLSEPL